MSNKLVAFGDNLICDNFTGRNIHMNIGQKKVFITGAGSGLRI